MTSLTGGNAADKDIRKLMEQIIAERDAKFAPKKEGGEAAPTGGMFDKPEVKANVGDVITDLLGYLEQKRTEALDSYQSKVMRRSSKPLPKPEDIDVSSFLSEAGLSSQPEPLTFTSDTAPALGEPELEQIADTFIVKPSKTNAKPKLSEVLLSREDKPVEELTDDEKFLRTGKLPKEGLMSPVPPVKSLRPKARPEGLTDDDMGLASESGYAFMASNSLFRTALKEKEAGSYSTLFADAQTTNTPWKGTDITNMKMSDVLDLVKANGEFHKYNKNKHNKNTTAIGKYQFIGSTLRDLKKRGVFDKLGITDDTLFDAATQDSLAAYQAIHRLKDRAKGTLSSARTEMRNEWEGFKKLSNSDLNNIITEIGSEIGVEFSDRTDPIRTSRPKARP